MEPGKYVKHDREFWIQKWQSFQGDSLGTSRNFLPNREHGRFKERKEKLEKMIEEGKSPKEIWKLHMEEFSKDGRLFKFGPFSKPEIKQKWEEMEKEGKSDEFWEKFWNETHNDSHIGPKFINPHDMQKRWEVMQAEGKKPEEFWKEEKDKFMEKVQDSQWGRHHWMRNRQWNKEGETNEHGYFFPRHGFGRYCGYWHKRPQKEYDEEYLFKEFDF